MKFATACAVLSLSVGSSSAFGFGLMPRLPVSASKTAQGQTSMLFGGGAPKDDKSGGGMNMGNMMETLKKANEMGAKTKALQADLQKMNIEGASANGKVKVFVTGQQMPCGCEVDPSMMSGSREALQEAVVEAMTSAHRESMVVMTRKLQELYAEMGLPMGAMGGPK